MATTIFSGREKFEIQHIQIGGEYYLRIIIKCKTSNILRCIEIKDCNGKNYLMQACQVMCII